MSYACAWCHRQDGYPLRAGEICEVCLGLCAFAFLPAPAAASLYLQSVSWVEQVFAFHYAERALGQPEGCWWCARPGYDTPYVSQHPDRFYAAPTLCQVCDGLFIPKLPAPDTRLARLRSSYDELCRLV